MPFFLNAETQWQVLFWASSFILFLAIQTYVLAFVGKQISMSLSYFYQARLFFRVIVSVWGGLNGVGILYLSEAQQLKTNYKLIWIWISAVRGS